MSKYLPTAPLTGVSWALVCSWMNIIQFAPLMEVLTQGFSEEDGEVTYKVKLHSKAFPFDDWAV